MPVKTQLATPMHTYNPRADALKGAPNQASQHTPGPWTVTAGKKHETEIYGPNGLVVATTYDCDDSFPAIGTSGIEKANARLIAAAPELLAALEACIAALNYREHRANEELLTNGYNRMPTSQSLSMAFSAVHKAKGQA